MKPLLYYGDKTRTGVGKQRRMIGLMVVGGFGAAVRLEGAWTSAIYISISEILRQ